MAIFHHVRSIIDRATGHAIIFENKHRFRERQARTPASQYLIKLGLVDNSVRIGGIFNIRGHIGSAHGSHQAGKDGITVAANHQEFTIPTFVGIGGHDTGYRGSRGLTNNTCAIIFGNNSFQQIKHGFVERHINHLTTLFIIFYRLVSRTQGHQYANHRMESRHRVANT